MSNHSSKDEFQYSALPPEGWTRLLVLHPGDGPLSCSLQPARLDDCILSYEAISYVWGDDALKGGIRMTCNDQNLAIGANLACALTYISCGTKERVLWVDAICIDQEDSGERSQQVQQMGRIYEGAQKVLIWIGEDRNGEAEECFHMIKQTVTFLTNLLAIYESVEKIPHLSPTNESTITLPRDWGPVRRLMDAPWFTRVWTLQEVGLARSAAIVYGKARVDIGVHAGDVKSGVIWDVFEGIWCSFANPISWRNELPYMASLAQITTDQKFLDTLNITRPYQATDPRDRFHPQAANIAGNGDKFIFVDYSKSVAEVYFEVASHIVRRENFPWMVLSSVDHTLDSPALVGQRPSWVPWWDEDWRVYWLGYATMWYRAGGLQPLAFRAEVASCRQLHVRGIIFDAFDWVSAPFTADTLRSDQKAFRNPMGKLWEALPRDERQSKYGGGRDSEIAFSLAVAAGPAGDEGPAEDDLELHCSIYELSQSPLYCSSQYARRPVPSSHEESLELGVVTYFANQVRALHNRRLFRTLSGYYGICHLNVNKSDVCCVLRGANVPFVLRRAADTKRGGSVNCYRLVGESYVQGVMNGEIVDMVDSQIGEMADVREEEIVIV